MNITQLKYVLALAGAASMREAAARLYFSQPALAASVRELENDIRENEEPGYLELIEDLKRRCEKAQAQGMRDAGGYAVQNWIIRVQAKLI